MRPVLPRLTVALAMTADLILTGGPIYTVDPARPRVEAIAIAAGRIQLAGDTASVLALKGQNTRVIDLTGRAAVPGLIDAHGHISGLGFAAARLDLTGTTSAAQIAALVKARAATLPEGRWIRGRGWDQNDWKEKAFPTAEALDAAAPAHPVLLDRVDGHAVWVNTAAMRLAGITKSTPDPPGGRIVRDASGEATGVFVDAAEGLIASKAPPPTRQELREALSAGMQRCLAAGLTGVHDAGVDAAALSVYRELLVDGVTPFRVYAMLSDDETLVAERFGKGPEIGLGDGRLTVRSVKMYMDGALGSRGAALLAPYSDDAANSGLQITTPERLADVSRKALAAGFQINVHAIGDRGNRLALDAMQTALAGRRDARFRIEHAQVLSLDDIPRFASLGVIASMQPTHATSDMYWAEDRLGAARAQGAYAWRRLLDAGARLACGSDFPVESERPMLGFYAAITRQDPKGWPEGGWHPDQRLTRDEALRCFTLDAAWAAFQEAEVGSLQQGKRADITVLSADIMSIPPAAILTTDAVMTIVGGQVAWERK